MINMNDIQFLVGNNKIIENMNQIRGLNTFDDKVIDFFDRVSAKLMKDSEARKFSDVITFAFWIRKANLIKYKEKYRCDNKLGRGTAFHITPSNVAVNYAYSFAVGLLAGNANIVRLPSKEYAQISIINNAIKSVLAEEDMKSIEPYVCFIRYSRNKEVTDKLSSLCDIRVIWGGDNTISEIRKSPIGARCTEIAFADRYSLCVIDGDFYNKLEDVEKDKTVKGFYNDTYLSDQNACTSPRVVIWNNCDTAIEDFWRRLHSIVSKEYGYEAIMGVNKLSTMLKAAVALEDDGLVIIKGEDNKLVRIQLQKLNSETMKFRESCGFFYEYIADDICELYGLCDNVHCQTVSYIGAKNMLKPLLDMHPHGIDRVVPCGHTMDFDIIWDGFNLIDEMSRQVVTL